MWTESLRAPGDIPLAHPASAVTVRACVHACALRWVLLRGGRQGKSAVLPPFAVTTS
jgi:hypothetical protein